MGFLGALSIADVLKQERCARVLRRDDPAAQTAGGGRAPARARTITADYALDAALTLIRLKMPGWTCMHMIVTRATKP
jgi:hypothetical protein